MSINRLIINRNEEMYDKCLLPPVTRYARSRRRVGKMPVRYNNREEREIAGTKRAPQ